MLQYVDTFSCATDEKSKQVVIHFKQNEPIVSEGPDGEAIVNIITNDVVSLVMNYTFVHELTQFFNQHFEEL